MLSALARGAARRAALLRRGRRDGGIVAILTAILLTTFIGLAAFSLDVGHWYLVREQTQKAADAAALAGASHLPTDLTGASADARAYSALNGFPNGGATTVTSATTSVPGELRVDVTTTVQNFFTPLFGIPTTTIHSTATAAYVGPVKMGSPCNQMGFDPDATAATQSSSCDGLAGGRYWANVNGRTTDKANGDPYQSTVCTPSTDNCPGGVNSDYTAAGYDYNITLKRSGTMTVQLFDPEYAATGADCKTNLDNATAAVNPFVTATGDAATRYASGNDVANRWCTGDNSPALLAGSGPATTSTTYTLLGTAGGEDPATHAPVPGCSATFGGYDGALFPQLDAGNPAYQVGLARTFRQWVDLCNVSAAGTYILQVTTGDGHVSNHFSVRAIGTNIATTTVSGRERIGVFTSDQNSTTQFYLARVPTTAAGQTLVVRFFDIGDAKGNGTMSIQPPSGVGAVTCGRYDVSGTLRGTLNPCQIATSKALDGKWVTLRIPIPTTYTCADANDAACWYRVSFDYKGAGPTDVSAWTAEMDGQPIRLVR